MFAGGSEDLHWTMTVCSTPWAPCPLQYNETPEKASRAYDANRDGFVIAGGGGMLVVESWSMPSRAVRISRRNHRLRCDQ